MNEVYIISGYWRDDGGAVEAYAYPHATLKEAKAHLKELGEYDEKIQPNNEREVGETYYVSYDDEGYRYELEITKEKMLK